MRNRASLSFQLALNLWTVAVLSCVIAAVTGTWLVMQSLRSNLQDSILESVHEIRSVASDLRIDQEAFILPSLLESALKMRLGKIIRVFDDHGQSIYTNLSVEDASFLDVNLKESEEYELLTIEGPDREYAVIHASYRLLTGEDRIFQVATPVPRTGQILRELGAQYLLVFLVLVMMLSYVASRLSKRILAPVENTAHYLLSLRHKPIKKWLPIPQKGGSDFLEDIIDSTNMLIAHVQESNLFHEHLARSIAHEIRTPLTMMLGEIETMDIQRMSSQDLLELRQRLSQDIMQIDLIVKTLLELAQRGRQNAHDEPESVNLNAILRDCFQFFESVFRQPVTLINENAEEILINVDSDLFKVLVDNLLRNYRKHASTSAPVTVKVNPPTDHHIVLEVLDEGPGLNAELLEVANSPTPWDSRLGVGLNLCKQICSKTGWSLRFENREPTGLIVSIRVPLAFEALDKEVG